MKRNISFKAGPIQARTTPTRPILSVGVKAKRNSGKGGKDSRFERFSQEHFRKVANVSGAGKSQESTASPVIALLA
jgi:hypothetical protein